MTYAPAKKARNPLDLNEKVIVDLALGVDDDAVIAARYNFDEFEFAQLVQEPMVRKAVENRRAELERNGEFFRVKARILAEELLPRVFKDAESSADPKVRLDALKFMAGVAGVDKPPQDKAAGNAGPKFTISFKLGPALPFDITFGADDSLVGKTLPGEYEELDDD